MALRGFDLFVSVNFQTVDFAQPLQKDVSGLFLLNRVVGVTDKQAGAVHTSNFCEG